MSTAIGISTAGNFITGSYTPQVDADAGLKAAGVTDIALFDASCEHEDTVADSLKWLATLSPEQLKEETLGDFQAGVRVTTYADLKLYDQLENDLMDRASALIASDGTTTFIENETASTTNKNDAQALQAEGVLSDLQSDKAGSITEAESYLSAINQDGTSTSAASEGAMPRSAQSSASLSAGDIAEIFGQHRSGTSENESSAPSGWQAVSSLLLADDNDAEALSRAGDRLSSWRSE